VSHPEQQLDPHTLRLNLYLTQAVILGMAAIFSCLLHGFEGTIRLFHSPGLPDYIQAGGVVLLITASSIVVHRFVPRNWQDDGSINERVFQGLPLWKTFLLCAGIGIAEEWLFRGVVQSWAGNLWTSCFFALIHVRYLRKPLMVAMVFVTSYLLGCLYETHRSLLPPIAAHIGIDFLLAVYLQKVVHREGRNA